MNKTKPNSFAVISFTVITLSFLTLTSAYASQQPYLPAGVKDAIAMNNYSLFLLAVVDTKLEGKVSEEQFTKLVEKNGRNAAIKEAVIYNDYSAFLAVIEGTRLEGRVDEERFTKMVEIAREKLALKEAISSEDYAAFRIAVEGTKLAEKIYSQRIFKKFVRAHNLYEAGDIEAARAIFTSIGVSPRSIKSSGSMGKVQKAKKVHKPQGAKARANSHGEQKKSKPKRLNAHK